jgi:hypothetical protein
MSSPESALTSEEEGPSRHRLPRPFGKAARVGLRLLLSPRDGVDRVAERFAAVAERVIRRGVQPLYLARADWEQGLHGLLGAPWPCPAAAEFSEIWGDIISSLVRRGLRVGRGSYAGFDDADPGLARALWCLVHHLKPEVIVETGVARGLTSRVLLEALQRQGRGRLWSIDLPPLSIPLSVRRAELAAAVPASRRSRWQYLEGSSRRRLGPLLRELGGVDLFVHDSWHSTRNVLFELSRAWSALKPGGALLCDDIDMSFGFEQFASSVDGNDILHCTSDDGKRRFGFARVRANGTQRWTPTGAHG